MEMCIVYGNNCETVMDAELLCCLVSPTVRDKNQSYERRDIAKDILTIKGRWSVGGNNDKLSE